MLSEYRKQSNLALIREKYILKFNLVNLYGRINAIELEVYNHHNDRTYKVHNMSAFLKAYINKKVHKFTDKFSIDFNYYSLIIDEKNKAVKEILFQNYEMAFENSQYNANLFSESYAIVSNNQILKMVEGLKGQNINFKNKTHYGFSNTLISYHVSTEDFKFNFNFIHDEKKV